MHILRPCPTFPEAGNSEGEGEWWGVVWMDSKQPSLPGILLLEFKAAEWVLLVRVTQCEQGGEMAGSPLSVLIKSSSQHGALPVCQGLPGSSWPERGWTGPSSGGPLLCKVHIMGGSDSHLCLV